MAPFVYPYVSQGAGVPTKPFLPIKLYNPHTGMHFNTCGRVDSGADDCVFPLYYAQILGHNVKKGEEVQLYAYNSHEAKAFAHTLRIGLFKYEKGGTTGDFVYVSVNMPVLFVQKSSLPILGKSFLDPFSVTLDNPNEQIILDFPALSLGKAVQCVPDPQHPPYHLD